MSFKKRNYRFPLAIQVTQPTRSCFSSFVFKSRASTDEQLPRTFSGLFRSATRLSGSSIFEAVSSMFMRGDRVFYLSITSHRLQTSRDRCDWRCYDRFLYCYFYGTAVYDSLCELDVVVLVFQAVRVGTYLWKFSVYCETDDETKKDRLPKDERITVPGVESKQSGELRSGPSAEGGTRARTGNRSNYDNVTRSQQPRFESNQARSNSAQRVSPGRGYDEANV
jgi:hypothetical protein